MKRSKFLAKSPQHGCGDTEHTAGELLGQAGELLNRNDASKACVVFGEKEENFQ
jgi:hypothetical protein